MEFDIGAIASLWKLGLILLVAIIVSLFRKEIKILLSQGTIKFKRGDTEVELKNEEIGKARDMINNTQRETSLTESFSTKEFIEEKKQYHTSKNCDKSSEELKRQMLDAFFDRNKDTLSDVYNELQKQENNNEESIRNEALYLYLLYNLGDTVALKQLEKIEQIHKDKVIYSEILHKIGLCYMNTNNFNKASHKFRQAAENTEDLSKKARNIVLSANCIFEIDQEEAYQVIIKSINNESTTDAQYIYYEGLSSLYEKANEEEKMLLALEKASELRPNDSSILFSTAYAYKNDIFRDLSLLHYKNLLDFNPDNSAALNNIGVVYTECELYGLGKKAYKKAAELKNTLANSNLAYEYMRIGLYSEAYEILGKAKQEEEVHKNVWSAYAYLKEKEEEEQKEEKEIINKAIKKQRFIREYASAYFIPYDSKNLFQGDWIFEDNSDVLIGLEYSITN